MYKRLFIVSIVVLGALCGLCVLGLYSINLHAEGLAGRRQAEFTSVAEQIRRDVTRKLDEFIRTEQQRPYAHYQYYYVPETSNTQQALLRSPLAGTLEHGLAFGHFQIDPDGTIITPFYQPQQAAAAPGVVNYIESIKQNLLGALNGNDPGVSSFKIDRISKDRSIDEKNNISKGGVMDKYIGSAGRRIKQKTAISSIIKVNDQAESKPEVLKATGSFGVAKKTSRKSKEYRIESLKEEQQTQILNQSRNNVELNISNRAAVSGQLEQTESEQKAIPSQIALGEGLVFDSADQAVQQKDEFSKIQDQIAYQAAEHISPAEPQLSQNLEEDLDTVQVRIEPFVPIVVSDTKNDDSLFSGEVFLLRHIQIEDKHFRQGFRLNQTGLIEQVKESAGNLVRSGMGFELSNQDFPQAAHVAILDFGFAQMVLNLLELDPGWITKQVGQLKNLYMVIITVVFIVTLLALISLWRNIQAQVKLARKKDDFISAVSHELRTPLTSIRMYTEMLENDWVKTNQKRSEYYSTMRQESERLSRLIENVLDFSRIQRGKKKYFFKLSDINQCVSDVVNMMTPFAGQSDFTIQTDFTVTCQVKFDSDAITQIVINLLDNAIKYARSGVDKTIIVRTRMDNKYTLIEVEDHGPGMPSLQRKKVFDEFYRIGNESTRETTGTGLGLALVKKLTEAHQGFVEILSVKPSGTILKVGLAKHI